MALVHLLSAAQRLNPVPVPQLAALRELERMASLDRFKQHTLTPDSNAADVILFVETHNDDSASGPFFEHLLSHPIYRQHREKCLIHSGMDHIVPLVRGFFPSIEARDHDPRRTRGASYLASKNPQLAKLDSTHVPTRWLGSFIGSAKTHPVRSELLQIRHERLLLKDNGPAFVAAIQGNRPAEVEAMKREYAHSAIESKFILCPRGVGTSSIRLFEAMELARVPVILSDAWVEPPGPAWDSFSLRLPQRDVARIPAMLLEHEPRWPEMARLAREAWLEHFSDSVLFHRLIEQCLELNRSMHNESLASTLAHFKLLRPQTARRYVRARRAMKRSHV